MTRCGRNGDLTTPRWRGNLPLKFTNLTVPVLAASGNEQSRPVAACGVRPLFAIPHFGHKQRYELQHEEQTEKGSACAKCEGSRESS